MPKRTLSSRLNEASQNGIDYSDWVRTKVNPKELIPSEMNFYSMNTDELEELADNMAMVGQLQPILVGIVNGEKRIVAGHRRTRGAIINQERGKGFETVDIATKEMTEDEFELILLSANMFVRPLTDYEKMEQVMRYKNRLKRCVEAGTLVISGTMRKYMADTLHTSETKIAQMEKIENNLCEEGKEALAKEEITFTTAYEAAKLPKVQQVEVIQNKTLISKDVTNIVQEKKELQKTLIMHFYERYFTNYMKKVAYNRDKPELIRKLKYDFEQSMYGCNELRCNSKGVWFRKDDIEITWTVLVSTLFKELDKLEQDEAPQEKCEPHRNQLTTKDIGIEPEKSDSDICEEAQDTKDDEKEKRRQMVDEAEILCQKLYGIVNWISEADYYLLKEITKRTKEVADSDAV